MPLTTGQVLQNRYRIVSLLGQGGMGAVYRAWHLGLEKPVALKEMTPQPGLDEAALAGYRTQFRQEAVILAKLTHPNLVPVTDYFEENGNDYLAMAFVEGESLADRIRRDGALPEADVIAWAQQLLDALSYCHERNIVHRDIKPQNVIITPEGQAVLVDFGLVKLWDPADPRTRTAMHGAGTPEYAPPEQWGASGRHTDPRSDLYSLGATLYHALTGQAPLTASDRIAYPRHFKTPQELTGRVSGSVNDGITRSMALACDNRWPDARTMAAALGSAASSGAVVTTPAAPVPATASSAPSQAVVAAPVVPESAGVSPPAASSGAIAAAPAAPSAVDEPPSPVPAEPQRNVKRQWLLALGIFLGVCLVGCVVGGILSLAAPADLSTDLSVAIFLGVPGISLWIINRAVAKKLWWLLIPGGVLCAVALGIGVTPFVESTGVAVAALLGCALTFVAVYAWAPNRRHMWWALIIAGAAGILGLAMPAVDGFDAFTITLSALFLIGGYLLLRKRRGKPETI